MYKRERWRCATLLMHSHGACRSLDGNSLQGGLPVQWSKFHQLAELTVADNLLSGNLPADWADLKLLKILHLAGNGFHGPLSNWRHADRLGC